MTPGSKAEKGNSSEVQSNQAFCHPRLAERVRRHLRHPSQRPAAAHTRQAFERLRHQVEDSGRPLVFDSFCGTGMSTAQLAARHPEQLVIGIDQSAHRLQRHVAADSENYLLVQADCGDFWRLAHAAGWRADHHYLLYPNPWPKSGQLQRRLHGSADFPALLALGGTLELRSNWQIYVEEFGLALNQAAIAASISLLPEAPALTLFEEKYRNSGHRLWRCTARLPDSRP